ncbi:MAG: response regulator [bacterium]|nr:response regulator [bacterium]
MKNIKRYTDQIGQKWLLALDGEDFVTSARLRNQSGGALIFETKDYLSMGKRVVACPVSSKYAEDGSDIALDREDVLNHADRITGFIVREEGELIYAVRLSDDSLDASDHAPSVSISEKAFQLTVEVSGALNMDRMIRVLSQIRQRSQSCLRLLIDFSMVRDIPPTAIPLVKDFVKRMIHLRRFVALIGCQEHCEKMASSVPENKYFKMFASRERADSFFAKNPIDVLVTEDEPATLAYITAFLDKLGLVVNSANTAEECIDRARANPPELILMDIHLPGMDGIEATRIIRQDLTLHHLPIIILTGDATTESVRAGKDAGITGYFLKPFNHERFTQSILKALSDAAILD